MLNNQIVLNKLTALQNVYTDIQESSAFNLPFLAVADVENEF